VLFVAVALVAIANTFNIAELDHDEVNEVVSDDQIWSMRVDVIAGMVSAVAVAFAIIVKAAVTLHPAGITQIQTAHQAAQALRPFAGDFAGLLFALGIVGLGLLSVPVLAGSTAYAASEAVGWHEGLSKRFRDTRAFYAVIVLSMLVGLGMNFVGIDPIRGFCSRRSSMASLRRR
jgi:Mn2+/Fe2+ NRAMP family transporter